MMFNFICKFKDIKKLKMELSDNLKQSKEEIFVDKIIQKLLSVKE